MEDQEIEELVKQDLEVKYVRTSKKMRRTRRGRPRDEFYDKLANLVDALPDPELSGEVISLSLPKDTTVKQFQECVRQAMSIRGIECSFSYNPRSKKLEIQNLYPDPKNKPKTKKEVENVRD